MLAHTKVYKNENDVVNRLMNLNLSTSQLCEVVKHIGLTMNSFTEDHPSWSTGITTAGEAVYSLRSILREQGWTKEEEKGFALAVHPEGKLAINVAKGDEGTGNAEGEMTTVSDKGICTEVAIAKNQLSFGFPLEMPPETSERPTWYLVYCKKADGIHAELSLPSGMSEDKHIAVWRERIILPVVSEDSMGEITSGFDDGGYEISFSKKAK